jgi:DNA-directed RNA polymerase subunit RPC12/RpoP
LVDLLRNFHRAGYTEGDYVLKRKSLSKKLRFEIFKRDSFTCQYCGATPPTVVLHVDHITPVADGGENDMDNLITACEGCNQGKGARSLNDIPKSLQNRAKDIKEREDQIKGYSKVMEDRKYRLIKESWAIVETLEGRSQDDYRNDWFKSIKSFISKLGYYEVEDAAEITISRFKTVDYRAFKYFCGICWKKVRDNDNA